MLHCSKTLPIMLKLCSIFIPQFPCFANKLALLWVNSKYLKFRLYINPCFVKSKERPTLIEQSAVNDCSIRVYRSFLRFIILYARIYSMAHKNSAYYASIMLNAFRHLLCSKLCWHNRRVPNLCTTQVLGVRTGKYYCSRANNLPRGSHIKDAGTKFPPGFSPTILDI